MSKRKRGKSGARQSSRRVSPAPQLDLFRDIPKNLHESFSLVLTDRGPILREWRERYRTLERELTELSKKTEDYHFQAVPAFQAWVARSFGEELSAIRELEEKIREAEIIALATMEEARASDCPEAEAYRVVLLRKERGEDLFPAPDDWEGGWAEVEPDRDYANEASGEEPPPRRESRESAKDPDEVSREYFRAKENSHPSSEGEDLAGKLKVLYRKLAFALHPDANPNQSARERKIWDEVQIAYAEKDLDRLEMLHAWIESGSEGWLDRLTHVGTLRTLVLNKLTEVRSSHVGFNRLRKAAPWKYWSAREIPERVEVVRQDLEEGFVRDFLALQRRLREFELHFRRWGSDERRPSRRRRR